jgi:hypothetical protein
MKARLHNNGVEVRVDLGNTGENWPNCQQLQKGFPWLNFGVAAWQHAEDFARKNGATEEIIKTGLRTDAAEEVFIEDYDRGDGNFVDAVTHNHDWVKSIDGGTYVCKCGAWK